MYSTRGNFKGDSGITDAEASVSFIAQFLQEHGDDHVSFHSCSLIEAITEACFAPVQLRKILLLYFHNKDDSFSKMFCPLLVSGQIRNILESSFYLLGWDVSDTLYHSALKESLEEHVDFHIAQQMLAEKQAALFVIYPIENAITVISVLHGSEPTSKAVLTTLESIEKNFKMEKDNETELEKLKSKVNSENNIGSTEFQQLMYDRLGDRDYDCFEYSEHEYLKDKIGYALYGPPTSEDGCYEKKQNKAIEETYKQICEQNNLYAEWQNEVVVSFIYNCLEPLTEEKLKRAKEFEDYNPYTDIMPIPLYVIRKCIGSNNPCRIFIDSDNRVYSTWHDYIENNKLHKCTIVLPKEGRYSGNENGEVRLETHLSPSCGIGHTILRTTDLAATGAGLLSGGVFIAAMIPAVTVAPFALTGAAVTGIIVGGYSVVRSATNMYDRYVHGESMSFANSEARGAYINIVAGSLGFVGAGATAAVSQLAARGVNIGQGAQLAVNAINITNVTAGGVGVANATYQIVDDWITEQRTPSLLTVVQLSSSILFFGNAVYNFKSAGTIIEETQTNALRDYQESLRSNRHRKTFNKMTKETIRLNNGDVQAGQAEVISTIRQIQNKDEVFAILTRNNKLFNKKGIKFAATEQGEIQLNGISVDLNKFGSMTKSQRTQFLIDLPPTPQPTPAQTNLNISQTKSTIQVVFGTENFDATVLVKYGLLMSSGPSFTKLAAELLQDFSDIIQEKIIRIVKASADELIKSININILEEYFPNIGREPLSIILRLVIDFLKDKMNNYEAEYREAKELAKQSSDFNEDKFNKEWGVHPDTGKRAIFWFEKAVNIFVSGNSITESLLRELIQYIMNRLTETLRDRCDSEERRKNREKDTKRNAHKIVCKVCGGYYFSKTTE